jgi:hypothetical protein
MTCPRMNDDYWWASTPWMMGYASILPPEPENEKVRRLHEVVEEVTGRPVEQPAKPRIGFLP